MESSAGNMHAGALPANIWEEAWLHLRLNYGDFGVFVFFYFSLAVLYGLGGFFFWIADQYHFFPAYKIQYEKYATREDYIRCIKNLLTNYVLIIFPLGCVSCPLTRFINMTYDLPLPSLKLYLFHIALCLIGEDFCHYWMHRFFHTPWFYKNIHKEHHYYATPFGLAATYSHPVEVIFLGIATFTPGLLIRPHFFTFYSWFVIRQLDAVITHSGYEFPFNPLNYIPFYGGTAFHDYHHKAFNCNYASRLTWTDHLFGTFRDYPFPPAASKKEK